MVAIRLLSAVKKPITGTPGSSAVQRGFDLRIETRPYLEAYRVAVVYTPNAWQEVRYAECQLDSVQNGTDIWVADISYFTTPQVTFFYALAAAGPNGTVWDNNRGLNHQI